MANLIITKNCNLNCSYCFAQNYMSSPGNTIMELEDLNNILNYFKKAPEKVHHISIMGGEPLLHPQFEDIYLIVKQFCKDYSIKNSPSIFTNGINLSQFRDTIKNSKIILNINNPNIIGENNWNQIKQGILELKGDNELTLGINLYNGMPNYNYFFELAVETKLLEIRCSITAPYGEKKEQNRFEYADEHKQLFLNFIQDAKKYKIQPRVDCNYIPKCRFTEEELNILEEAKIISMDWCYPAIDILPDMTCYSCFGFQNPVNLLDFENLEQVEQYLLNNYSIPKVESREYCVNNCPLEIYSNTWESTKCQGGCLGFNN